MPRRELLLIGEMIDAGRTGTASGVGPDVDDIEADRHVRDALLCNVTALGEAAAQLPDAFKKAYPSVNWARPSQLRNRIVHGY